MCLQLNQLWDWNCPLDSLNEWVPWCHGATSYFFRKVLSNRRHTWRWLSAKIFFTDKRQWMFTRNTNPLVQKLYLTFFIQVQFPETISSMLHIRRRPSYFWFRCHYSLTVRYMNVIVLQFSPHACPLVPSTCKHSRQHPVPKHCWNAFLLRWTLRKNVCNWTTLYHFANCWVTYFGDIEWKIVW
jgi:hypothetical protein